MTTTTMNHITETELRDLLESGATLEQLAEAIPRLPVNLRQFRDRLADLHGTSEAEAGEAIKKALQACALPGHAIGDDFAALMDRAILQRAAARPGTHQEDRAFLLEDLREAIDTDDEAGLLVAIGMSPFKGADYYRHLLASVEAMPQDAPVKEGEFEALKRAAVKAAGVPGATIDDELAEAILAAVEHLHTLSSETPQQRAIRQAFKKARRLIDLHGDEDPRAFAAIVRAVNLQDPDFIDEKLKESGIHLPKPDRCTDDGVPLFSLEAVAEALDADPEELLVLARELDALGTGDVLFSDAAAAHTLQ